MSTSTLEKLKRAVEQTEQELAREFSRVGGVVEERRLKLSELREEALRVKHEVAELSHAGRLQSLRAGLGLGNVNRYVHRLQSRLEKLTSKISALENDLARSIERERLAQTELQEATVERKKVEQLIEGKARRSMIDQAALDERVNEEQQSGWLKNRWRKN